MRVSEIINFSGILIGIIAAICSTILYFRASRTKKSISLEIVGLLNLIICLSMVAIVITAYVVHDIGTTGNTSSINDLTLISVFIIGFFIVCQTLYLFSPLSPIKQFNFRQSGNKQIPLENGGDLESLEKIEEILREYLQNVPNMKSLQIFDMSSPLDTTKMYISTKVYSKPLQFLSEQIEMLEEQFTPLDRLNKKLEILEKRDEGAIDPLQVIVNQNNKQCVLLGEPGIGKTTYLKYLTISMASKKEGRTQNFLPLYIALNDYANSRIGNLFNYIVEIYRKRYFSTGDKELLQELIENKLIDGTAFILLDGLDETLIGTSAKTTYKKVCDQIEMFAGSYENAYIIVTSRKTSYELREKLMVKDNKTLGREFKCLEIAGFLRSDIRNFVEQWFEERPSNDKGISAENLLLKLEQDSRLRELSHNPLLLSILTLAYTRRMKITHRRAKLYDDCTTALLKDWDKSRTVERTNEDLLAIQNELPELKITILKELAWHFHNLELSYFSREDALVVIDELLKREQVQSNLNEQILEEIIINSGLLQKLLEDKKASEDEMLLEDKKVAENYYYFSHITFQEYFAAKYMVDAVKNGQALEKDFLNRWSDPWWEEVVLLYAGLTSKLSSVLIDLKSQNRNDIYYSNVLFASRCIAAASVQSQNEIHEVIQYLYKILQETTHEHLADRVANTLIEVANQDVNLSLLKMLGAKFDNEDFSDKLLMVPEKLIKGFSIIARTSIAEALGTCSDRGVSEKLKDMLVNEQGIDDDKLIASIADTLGKLGNKSVAEDLVKKLSRPTRDGIKNDIIDVLRSLREPLVVPQLCNCLSSSNVNDDEKSRIADTLGVLGPLLDTQEMKKTLSQKLLDVIRNQETPTDVGCACIGAFGKWRFTDVIPELQNLLNNKDSWPLCSRMAVVLNLLGKGQVQPGVRFYLLQKNVNEQAILSFIPFLVEQNAASLVSELVPLVIEDDENVAHEISPTVRRELAKTLGEVGDDDVATKLLDHLSSLAEALSISRNEKVAEQLSAHLEDISFNPLVYSEIVLALGTLYDRGKLKDEKLFESLRKLIVNLSSDKEILWSCVKVISEFSEIKDRKDALEMFKGILEDRDKGEVKERKELENTLQLRSMELENTLQLRSMELENVLPLASKELQEIRESRSNELENVLQLASKKIVEIRELVNKKIKEAYEFRRKFYEDSLNSASEELGEILQSVSNQLGEIRELRSNQLGEILQSVSNQLGEIRELRSNQLGEIRELRNKKPENTLEFKIEDLEEALRSATRELEEICEFKIEELEVILQIREEELEEILRLVRDELKNILQLAKKKLEEICELRKVKRSKELLRSLQLAINELESIHQKRREIETEKEELEDIRQLFIITRGMLGDNDEKICHELAELLTKKALYKGEEAREQIVKALITLSNLSNDSSIVTSPVPDLLNKLRDTTFSLDIRRSIVKVIKRIGTDADTCESLWQVMDNETIPDLKEDIYEAIWEISRRVSLRVYWDTASSKIRVEKVKPLKMELPATAGSQI
ncbi:MAG: NACHT domain-containing protein [Ktedonobacteraceae bacterium]